MHRCRGLDRLQLCLEDLTHYLTMQEGDNTSSSALPHRISQSGVIRHLYARADAYPPTAQVVTLYTGASSGSHWGGGRGWIAGR
jgi:hypothetical protein